MILERGYDGNLYWKGNPDFQLRTHTLSNDCMVNSCVIHNPTEHCMNSFPLNWREDRILMERICPHGIGHPDPDGIAFLRRSYGDRRANDEAIHGCDGCCIDGDIDEVEVDLG